MRAFLLFSLLLAGLATLGAPASRACAQEGDEYQQAIQLGSQEFEAGNYAEARAQFTRAHQRFANARTLRALGMVEYELKNYGDCIAHLEGALASSVRPLEPSQREDAEALLARARGYVARVNLEVEPNVATVLLDGVPVKLDEGRTLVVQVGDHMLEFRAPGRLAEKRLVKVSGGEERTLHVVLSSPEANASAAHKNGKAPDAPHSERTPLYKKAWLWVVVGVVAAGVATGVAIALTRDKDPAGSSDPDMPTLTAP